jgi:hypothetical protein
MEITSLRRVAATVLGVVLLAGCSGGGGSTGVASLSGTGDTAATDTGASTQLTEEKALEFSQCMRDNGVADFPDPTVDADGNVQLGRRARAADAEGAPTQDDTAFRTAREACSSILQGLTFGGGRGGPGGGFDNTQLQDALVQFSDCLRGEGLDVGDLSFGRPQGQSGQAQSGQGQAGTGSTNGGTAQDAPPDGQRGPGGDPTQRMIERLGLDPNDPAVQAALEKCQPILQSAFANLRQNATSNGQGGGQ